LDKLKFKWKEKKNLKIKRIKNKKRQQAGKKYWKMVGES